MHFHPGWRLKAVLPVAVVLLGGLAVFEIVTVELQDYQRYRLLAVAAGGALAVCAVLLVALALLIQRPLIELSQKIEQVRGGNLDARVAFSERQDDVGRLGRNFNDMVRQLREGRDELQLVYQTQMSRAEHLATLGELAAGLAHEVRNPLAGISGAVDIIGRELPPSSPHRLIAGEVQQEVRRIHSLLTELLDYARPKPCDIHSADLNATIEHCVQLARQQVVSRPIEVVFAAGDLPPVAHDPFQIERLILNLLLNAFQAIPKEGTVTIGTASEKGFALIAVRDTGTGISAEQLPNIFRPFFTTKRQGTGLGLSLSRRIVEQHGGHIEVHSKPGQGTEFLIWLPLASQELAEAGSLKKWQSSKS
ncbi:MAG TPA: ATP-binding protein [Patescibacteria group bacterium]|nr:ATP-binding protein [Patescibacteria group bacterium]